MEILRFQICQNKISLATLPYSTCSTSPPQLPFIKKKLDSRMLAILQHCSDVSQYCYKIILKFLRYLLGVGKKFLPRPLNHQYYANHFARWCFIVFSFCFSICHVFLMLLSWLSYYLVQLLFFKKQRLGLQTLNRGAALGCKRYSSSDEYEEFSIVTRKLVCTTLSGRSKVAIDLKFWHIIHSFLWLKS